jgi:hypothetical protein
MDSARDGHASRLLWNIQPVPKQVVTNRQLPLEQGMNRYSILYATNPIRSYA